MKLFGIAAIVSGFVWLVAGVGRRSRAIAGSTPAGRSRAAVRHGGSLLAGTVTDLRYAIDDLMSGLD